MTKRNEWTFRFPVRVVEQACELKVKHHTERLAHWTKAEEEAKQDLKNHGIDWHSVVDTYSNATAYNQQPMFHQEKLRALNDAQNRVKHHRMMLDTFEDWLAILNLSTARELDMHFEDVLYFDMPKTVGDERKEATA